MSGSSDRRRSVLGCFCAVIVAGALGGCSGSNALKGAFSTDWQNDGGRSIGELERELASASLPQGTGVAVGVTSQGLVGITLDGKRWKRAGRVDARPSITGDVVVATGGGQLFALDAGTGKELWSVSAGGRALRGAGDDGTYTVASLGSLNGGQSRLLVVDRSGQAVLDAEPEPEIGTPAIKAGVAFIPWGNQYVSAIDVKTGAERARLLMRQQVTQAVNLGGALFFGETELVRFDTKVGGAPQGNATQVVLPRREYPGKPRWFAPGAEVQAPSASAPDRIRMFAKPNESGQFEDDRFATTYFRVAMGASASDGALRWVKLFGSDILGGAAASGGFAFCGANGEVALIDGKTGGDAGKLELGEAVSSCEVQGGDFKVPSQPAALALPEQLGKAIAAKDAQMVIAQRFLLGELAALKDDSVTRVLIELASNPDTPPMLFEDSRKMLAERKTGAEHMLAALEREYDFLDDVLLPPPVGPLADALAAMNEPKAAAPLARHLNDPADSPDDIMRAARALEKLATAQEFEELRTFFALYRATASDDTIVAAVISVAKAMLRVGGKEGRELLNEAARDPLTHSEIQTAIQELKPTSDPAKPAGKTAGK